MSPTPLLIHNGHLLVRGNPGRFALADGDSANCFSCDPLCRYFADFTPDCVALGISGIGSNDDQCECLEGTYYLPWAGCTPSPQVGYPPNYRGVCRWALDYDCNLDLPCFGEWDQANLEAYLWCVPTGFHLGVRIPYWDLIMTGGEGHLYHYSKRLGYDLACASFAETLTKASWTPDWAPETVTLSGAHGHAASDLNALWAQFARFSGPCADCGAVATQYEVTLAGFPLETGYGSFCGYDPNGTFALTYPGGFCKPTFDAWVYYFASSQTEFCRIVLTFDGSPSTGCYVNVRVEHHKNFVMFWGAAYAHFRHGSASRIDCDGLNGVALSFLQQVRWPGSETASVTVTAL